MELILKLLRYFSRFVPVPVLNETMIQPVHSRLPGYSLLQAEITASPALPTRISDIEKFILSGNEKFVSERIRNSKGYILFVDYDTITADFKAINGVRQKIGVTVAHNFSDANNDNLNEILLTERCLDILLSIIRQMEADQGELDFCASDDLISMPVTIHPVDPTFFYGCGGWCALFDNTTTILF